MNDEITLQYIVSAQGDYAAIYFNEVLHHQGHQLDIESIIKELEGKTVVHCLCGCVTDELFDLNEDFPERYKDIPRHLIDCW